MLGELRNLPTDTLLDIVIVILAGGLPVTLSEVAELGQIHRELQRRRELEGAHLCHTAIGLQGHDWRFMNEETHNVSTCSDAHHQCKSSQQGIWKDYAQRSSTRRRNR
jgi:hypothetical protein